MKDTVVFFHSLLKRAWIPASVLRGCKTSLLKSLQLALIFVRGFQCVCDGCFSLKVLLYGCIFLGET